MPELSPENRERLVRSQRQLTILAVLAIIVLVAIVVALSAAGASVLPGALVGVAVGALLSIPHRRLLTELGLTKQEARAILIEERKRRKAVR
ncbi:hypothetical protein [Actinoplanes subglobosus]|uniref:Uncharacterized protein n=1 Tax=Actinoplanes subglobosus TaxID=1547892 RepID=A0ABV8J8B9_9ACTN